MSSRGLYLNKRPSLVIEHAGGGNLGNCYNSMSYKITSLHPMTQKELFLLRDAGFLGYGQEFYCYFEKADGSKVGVPSEKDWLPQQYKTGKGPEPTGIDIVPCVEVDDRTGKVLNIKYINTYSGKEVQPTEIGYYVYHCESRVDSSD